VISKGSKIICSMFAAIFCGATLFGGCFGDLAIANEQSGNSSDLVPLTEPPQRGQSTPHISKGPDSSAEKLPAAERSTIWTAGLQGNRHALKGGDGNELIGNSYVVSIGRGHVAARWFARASIDVIFGPYERVRSGQFDSDFAGTGAGAWWGYSAQPADLRDKDGGYGFALGLSYSDFSGRSIGRSRLENAPSQSKKTHRLESYALRATDMSIVPALFFSWLKEARPLGNTPEQLKTRIEGYLLTVGIAMPVVGYYRANMEYRRDSSSDGQEAGTASESGEKQSGGKVSEKGEFQGYSILVNFTTLFGI
jgi:hypothetical protein